MGYIILIFSVLIFTYSIIVIMDIFDIKHDNKFLVFILTTYSLFVLLFLSFYIKDPKAIDVYKGKTTLEIIYRDKIPIDSTVVWKR